MKLISTFIAATCLIIFFVFHYDYYASKDHLPKLLIAARSNYGKNYGDLHKKLCECFGRNQSCKISTHDLWVLRKLEEGNVELMLLHNNYIILKNDFKRRIKKCANDFIIDIIDYVEWYEMPQFKIFTHDVVRTLYTLSDAFAYKNTVILGKFPSVLDNATVTYLMNNFNNNLKNGNYYDHDYAFITNKLDNYVITGYSFYMYFKDKFLWRYGAKLIFKNDGIYFDFSP